MLTDVSGRSVSNTSVDVTTSDQREKLRFNQERAGLYLLRVSTAKQVVTLKVIKQ
ncbi:T9SS type A sorting domain-containing protein [Rothia nasimurium]|uniref:T9SS type A sorting domain-containing protein n=1 Tax=Rothia nasimurium TaxID=85336 RepID=UPI003C6DCB8D